MNRTYLLQGLCITLFEISGTRNCLDSYGQTAYASTKTILRNVKNKSQ